MTTAILWAGLVLAGLFTLFAAYAQHHNPGADPDRFPDWEDDRR